MSFHLLPSLTSRKIIRALRQLGFIEDRQKGSHLVMINHQTKRLTVVPVHRGKTVKKSLLRKIILEDAQISIEDFLKKL